MQNLVFLGPPHPQGSTSQHWWDARPIRSQRN